MSFPIYIHPSEKPRAEQAVIPPSEGDPQRDLVRSVLYTAQPAQYVIVRIADPQRFSSIDLGNRRYGVQSVQVIPADQLEICLIDAQHTPVESRLADIRDQVDHAYTIARDKSHQWHSASNGLSETNFKARIQTLLDSALPDSRYHKEIHIDDNVLLDVPTETRIELLRIIQEAVTNIIKHAKANQVTVLIYHESDRLMLCISDNGRGFTTEQPSTARGLGLPSIQQRVASMGGTMEINGNSSGVELMIDIPQPKKTRWGLLKHTGKFGYL